ncbi:hypothetical protein 7F23_29 [uncultured Caudovirales phage]|uniref:Uncharacterized protein n=1 Tax=uncultured Caudovirales phage TaxID=2100421 RepID=A0A2H4J250_9CAUD|nr:hypothetical protein 7F23_29 [uncultured Caudovirales phage]
MEVINNMQGNQLRQAIEKGIPIAKETEKKYRKSSNTYFEMYIGTSILTIVLFSSYGIKMIRDGELTVTDIPLLMIAVVFMALTGSIVNAFIFMFIPFLNHFISFIGSLFLKGRTKKFERKIKNLEVQFEKETGLHPYFCNTYTLEKFLHYLNIGIADSLKECENLLRNEETRNDVAYLNTELSDMRKSMDRELDNIRRDIHY